jgi:hypothetical protein
MTSQQSNPLNGKFWVEAEYGGSQIQDKVAKALTAAYGAMGVAHLIERSISEMNLAENCDHEYAGLKPVLLENILCAQHVLLSVVANNIENVCDQLKETD